jgi:methylase of polypeptide subunit release factors
VEVGRRTFARTKTLVGAALTRTQEVVIMPDHSFTEAAARRPRPRCARHLLAAIVAAGLIFTALGTAQEKPDDDAIWNAFIKWFKSASVESDPFKGYAAKLGQEGVPEAEIQRRAATLVRLFPERPEAAEVFFDWFYTQPTAGNPAIETLFSTPTALLVDTVKGKKPGVALDVGMGQGRNAVYLASQGWDVTGMDISQAGLDAARANRAGSSSTSISCSRRRLGCGRPSRTS